MNDDEAETCEGCGSKFHINVSPESQPASEQDNMVFSEPLSILTKSCFFVGAWAFVLIKCLVWNPKSVAYTPFFPVGLIAWLPNGEEGAMVVWYFGGWIVGWAIYFWLSIAMFRARKARFFFAVYVLFCILLMFNVTGCKRVMDAASGLH